MSEYEFICFQIVDCLECGSKNEIVSFDFVIEKNETQKKVVWLHNKKHFLCGLNLNSP
jgi:hypothetical protein